MQKETLEINRFTFKEVLFGKDLDDWLLTREVIDVMIRQNSTYKAGFAWELDKNIARVFEKPYNYPEIFVPALNNLLNGGLSTWEFNSPDHVFTSCGECMFDHLVNDLNLEDIEFGENYITENLSATEDVFSQHAQANPDGLVCDCGVVLK